MVRKRINRLVEYKDEKLFPLKCRKCSSGITHNGKPLCLSFENELPKALEHCNNYDTYFMANEIRDRLKEFQESGDEKKFIDKMIGLVQRGRGWEKLTDDEVEKDGTKDKELMEKELKIIEKWCDDLKTEINEIIGNLPDKQKQAISENITDLTGHTFRKGFLSGKLR